jgi:hypothetical protein
VSVSSQLPRGITIDIAAQSIGAWLLKTSSYSSPAVTTSLRVHFELASLVSSIWVHDDVAYRRPDPACFAHFASKLELGVSRQAKDFRRLTVDESSFDINASALTINDISAPITAIVAVGSNQLLVGNQSGVIVMTSISAGGSMATLNAGASLAGSLMDRLNEWQRGYAYAHHKALVAVSAAGSAHSPIGPSSHVASTTASRLPSDLFQVGDTFEAWAEAPVPIATVKDFLQQHCLGLLQALSQDVKATVDALHGKSDTNLKIMWDQLERHVASAAASVDDDGLESTPQESFLDAFNTGAVRLSSPPTKSPGKTSMLKATPLTPTLVMPASAASPSFSDGPSIKIPPRSFTRSPRAAMFLSGDIPVNDAPVPPLSGFFTTVSHIPASPGANGHDSPQESLNGSMSLFEARPKQSRAAPRVHLAAPAPLIRPMSAGDAAKCATTQHLFSGEVLSPRQAQGRHRVTRLPLDMRLRYALHDNSRSAGPAPPPQANKTREMAMTTSAASATLSDRMKQFSMVNQNATDISSVDIGFGLMLPTK